MNKIRGILNLVVAVLISIQLLSYLIGIYYPSKLLIVLAMLTLIGSCLKWSVESFDSVLQHTKTTKEGTSNSG